MNRLLVSKILAVVWLAVPLAALVVAGNTSQMAGLQTMSRDQLISLAKGFYDDTFSKTFVAGSLFGLGYLAAVEGLAWLIRWVWGMLLGPELRSRAGAPGNSATADA